MRYVLFDAQARAFVSRFEYTVAWNDNHAIVETSGKINHAAKFSDARTAVFLCELINTYSGAEYDVVNEQDETALFIALYGDPADFRDVMREQILKQYPNAHFIDACGVIVGYRLYMRFKRDRKSAAVYSCMRDDNGEIKIVGGSPF